jgi:hypothetical protein
VVSGRAMMVFWSAMLARDEKYIGWRMEYHAKASYFSERVGSTTTVEVHGRRQ